MKKNMKLSFLVIVVVLVIGIFVIYQQHQKTFRPNDIVDIAMTKKQVLTNSQRITDPKIPQRFIKKFAGNEKILNEHLNKALGDAEALLLEIRTAILEGRIKRNTGGFHPPNSGNIEGATGNIFLFDVDNDGRFKECSKTYLSSGNVQKTETIRFYEDRKTLRTYDGAHGTLFFREDGIFAGLDVVIDGINHEISWDIDGKLVDYRVSDVK